VVGCRTDKSMLAAEVADWKLQLERTSSANAELRDEVKRVLRVAEALRTELKHVQEQRADLQAERNCKSATLTEWRNALAALMHEHVDLFGVVARECEDLQRGAAEERWALVRAHHERLAEADAVRDKLESENREVQARLKHVQQLHSALEAHNKDTTDTVLSLEVEIAQQQDKCGEAESKCKELRREVDEQMEHCRVLELERERVESQLYTLRGIDKMCDDLRDELARQRQVGWRPFAHWHCNNDHRP
jgi:chromosome segregation ATPase